MTHQPDEDSDLIERYRNAADTEDAAPSASTRAAILAEGRRAAAQRLSTLSSPFDTQRPAANQPRWKLAVWGSAAAVVLAAVLVLPRFLQDHPQVAATTARPSAQLPSERPAQPPEARSAPAERETGAPAAALQETAQVPSLAMQPKSAARSGKTARRDERESAVSSAVSSGDVPRLKQLLEQGAGTQQPDASGRTPLLLAVIANRPDLVRLLLEHGADPNAADAAGETPLQRARSDDHADIVGALLRAGAQSAAQ